MIKVILGSAQAAALIGTPRSETDPIPVETLGGSIGGTMIDLGF
ncbi:MAG: hypothetical protein AAGA05_05075 [Pseudomonadota bacterium]